MLQAEIKHDIQKNYLVIQGEKETDYMIQMLAGKHVKGFLDLEVRVLNNQNQFYYDITGMACVAQKNLEGKWNCQKIRLLLSQILDTVGRSKEYLLVQDHFILEPSYIFQKEETGQVFLCYSWEYEKNINRQFTDLFAYFMDQVDYEDQEAVDMIYRLYEVSRGENCTLQSMWNTFFSKEEKQFEQVEASAVITAASAPLEQEKRGMVSLDLRKLSVKKRREVTIDTNAQIERTKQKQDILKEEQKIKRKQSIQFESENAKRKPSLQLEGRKAKQKPSIQPEERKAKQKPSIQLEGRNAKRRQSLQAGEQNLQQTQERKQNSRTEQWDQKPKQNVQLQEERQRYSKKEWLPVIVAMQIAWLLVFGILMKYGVMYEAGKLSMLKIGAFFLIALGVDVYAIQKLLTLEKDGCSQEREQQDSDTRRSVGSKVYEEGKSIQGQTASQYQKQSGHPRGRQRRNPQKERPEITQETHLDQETPVCQEECHYGNSTAQEQEKPKQNFFNFEQKNQECVADTETSDSNYESTVCLNLDQTVYDGGHQKAEPEKQCVCSLVPLEEQEEEERIDVREFPFFIGRFQQGTGQLKEKQNISRMHCKLERTGEHFFLSDLQSTNGTYVNRERIGREEKKEVRNGDEIAIANIKYCFTQNLQAQ